MAASSHSPSVLSSAGVPPRPSLSVRLEALKPDARLTGGVLAVAGLVAVWLPSLWAGALGLELLAAAFWCWARAAADREVQLPSWNWLRRPAAAMWLAAAAGELLRTASVVAPAPSTLTSLVLSAQALGVAWAGLELLAALPLTRPFADRGGPLLGIGPWLPVVLPSTGFALLWRHVSHWTSVPGVRQVALWLLVLTAVLATLRAFSRGRWLASLRWLIVADCVLASALMALSVVPSEVSLLLWLGACGGHAVLLAGEMRSMGPRRVPASHALWRLSGWISILSLSWPLLLTLGFGPRGIASPLVAFPTALAVALAAWVMIRRMTAVPERRAVVRQEPAVSLTRLTGAFALLMGPIALVMAWWNGFETPWPQSWIALAPALLSGALAWWLDRNPAVAERFRPLAGIARFSAARLFRVILALERGTVGLLTRAARSLLAPSRDLHTGDAQEYLLFLIGLSVLALLIPVLRVIATIAAVLLVVAAGVGAGPDPGRVLLAAAPRWAPIAAAGLALLAGFCLLRLERKGRAGIGPVGALLALALGLAFAASAGAASAPLMAGLVIAALARDRQELLHGECALKLLWVMGSALALSWAGQELLTLATGTPVVLEQWAVLGLGLDPEFLWSTALPLSLLIGVVMLGGAPFHFWLADMFEGVRPWLAPLAAAGLQTAGAAWLLTRLDAVSQFAPGAELAWSLLRMAALIAFLAGAATLAAQRRPERRVGTMASLNGALVLALIASGREPDPAWILTWASHQALALTGVSALARFLPVSALAAPGAPLMRRHGIVAVAGLFSLFSLAGLPGTPGGRLWLEAATALGRSGHNEIVASMGIAWLVALWRAIQQMREAYGVPGPPREPVQRVPGPARAAIGISGAALVALAVVRWMGG